MTNNIAFTQILYCGVDFSVLGVLFHTESLFAAIHRACKMSYTFKRFSFTIRFDDSTIKSLPPITIAHRSYPVQ